MVFESTIAGNNRISLPSAISVPLSNEKGIILAEASLEVNGLTLKGAAIASSLGGNGAGIRDQITQPEAFLMVENSTFLDNQEGILSPAPTLAKPSRSATRNSRTTAIPILLSSSTPFTSATPGASR
jgi:hypothetical protein